MADTGSDELGAAQSALVALAVYGSSGRYSPSACGPNGCARGAFGLVDLGVTHY
jgi:hypothetical protein